MRILYVDDERSAHINFSYIIERRTDIRSIHYCFDYDSAINYAKDHEIDCAFLDISLPGKNGIELAKDLCSMQPAIELAFITSHDDFTQEAYKVGGRAYISKPYTTDEINNLLDLMEKIVKKPVGSSESIYDESAHMFAKTFGSFDFLVDGYPVLFKNSKAKELLAFLIHQMGGSVTNIQVFYALWEKQEYSRSTSTYVRRTIRALKQQLDELGIGSILISGRNNISLDFKQINCDAYELINRNIIAASKYNGEYMSQYSWGETSIPLLDRIANSLI